MIDITLNFDSYYADEVPESATYSGVYVVYAHKKVSGKDVWTLLDVGQGVNIYNRHSRHERKTKWAKYAKDNGMKLYIYCAKQTNEHKHLDIAEAAILYKFQPLIPTDGKEGYHHGDAKIDVHGLLGKAFGTFTVKNTDNK